MLFTLTLRSLPRVRLVIIEPSILSLTLFSDENIKEGEEGAMF
jgi:hypothetical protein